MSLCALKGKRILGARMAPTTLICISVANHSLLRFKEAKKCDPTKLAEEGRTDNNQGMALITSIMKWEIK